MAFQSFSDASFERAAQTTLANYSREVEEAMLRQFMILALLESSGRIVYNDSGAGHTWPVQYRLHDIEGNTGETQRIFSRKNLWLNANISWRGYQATDMIYRRELEENKGPEGIIKVFDGLIDRLDESMRQGMGRQFFINGQLSGNEQFWEGFETLFPATQTLNSSTGAARTANQGDYVAYPNGTYGGLSTVLGNYGGDNQSGQVWPFGIADPEFDFWSPMIVLYNSTLFSGGTSGSDRSFLGQGEEAMRFAMIHQRRNGDLNDQLSTWFLARDLYNAFLNKQDNRQEIQVQNGYTVRALGFTSVSFDGVEVTMESSVPFGFGYGIALGNVQLRCLQDRLFFPEGPTYEINDQAWKAVVSTLSNLKYKSPRNFAKLATHDNLVAA